MTGSNRSNAKIDKSVSKYLDQLHDQYSKVLALRVDVGYSKEHSQEMSLDEIKRDIKHLLNNRRSNRTLFEHQVGYVLKYEYTPCKGPHVHGLFLYDGQYVQKDSHIGEQLGQYWVKTTDGKGVYYNCNRDKNAYEQCGIGMIDHSDTAKRAILKDNIIPYMLKAEQSIDGLKSARERSVTKGIIRTRKSNAGRPRSQSPQ